MRDVGEEERSDVVGDRPKARVVQLPAVGAGAGDDRPRPNLPRPPRHLVVVDQPARRVHSEEMGLEEPSRVIDRVAMGQMTAFRQTESQDAISWFEKCQVDRQIGVRAGMRLHVGMPGAEQLLRSLDGQALDLVDELAAAVVPLPGIALGVLVRQHAADRLQHRRTDEVLRRDQLDRRLAGDPPHARSPPRPLRSVSRCDALDRSSIGGSFLAQ